MGLLDCVKGISSMPYNNLTVIMGKPGSGKTTLAGTYPKPMLYVSIDSDGGGVVLKGYSDDDVKVLTIKPDKTGTIYSKTMMLLRELDANPNHGYKSIVIDAYSSIEESMVAMIAASKPSGALNFDDRSRIGDSMRAMRDAIVKLSEKGDVEYVLICHVKTDEADDALSGEKTPYIIPKMTKNNGKVLLERASNVAYCARKTVKNAGEAPRVEFVTYLGGHPNIDTKLRTFGKKMDVGLYIVDCTYDKIESVKSGKPVDKATVVETAIADDVDNN